MENDDKVAEEFNKEFVEKIDNLRRSMNPGNIDIPSNRIQSEIFRLISFWRYLVFNTRYHDARDEFSYKTFEIYISSNQCFQAERRAMLPWLRTRHRRR